MYDVVLEQSLTEAQTSNQQKLNFKSQVLKHFHFPVCDFDGIKFADGAERVIDCNGW